MGKMGYRNTGRETERVCHKWKFSEKLAEVWGASGHVTVMVAVENF